MDPSAPEPRSESRAGRRKVPIAGVLRDYLDDRLRSAGEGFVFGADSPFNPRQLSQQADKAWEKAGLDRITLHECRHTFASMMIAAEVNAKALSTYMGHSSIRLTFDLYGHLMPGNEDEGAGLLDAHLDRANTQARLAAVESADGKVIMESRGKVMGKSNSHQTGPDGARRE